MFIVLTLCIILNIACPYQVFANTSSDDALRLTVADWAYEVRDQGDYDFNSTASFPKGERAYAYFELAGFAAKEENDLFSTDVRVDVALKTHKGLKLFSQKNVLIMDSLYEYRPDMLWFYIYVDVPWWAGRGEYTTELVIRDELSEEVLVASQDITIY